LIIGICPAKAKKFAKRRALSFPRKRESSLPHLRQARLIKTNVNQILQGGLQPTKFINRPVSSIIADFPAKPS